MSFVDSSGNNNEVDDNDAATTTDVDVVVAGNDNDDNISVSCISTCTEQRVRVCCVWIDPVQII